MSGKVQNIDIKAKTINKAPNKLYVEIDFGGMFAQKIGFDGEKGWISKSTRNNGYGRK